MWWLVRCMLERRPVNKRKTNILLTTWQRLCIKLISSKWPFNTQQRYFSVLTQKSLYLLKHILGYHVCYTSKWKIIYLSTMTDILRCLSDYFATVYGTFTGCCCCCFVIPHISLEFFDCHDLFIDKVHQISVLKVFVIRAHECFP